MASPVDLIIGGFQTLGRDQMARQQQEQEAERQRRQRAMQQFHLEQQIASQGRELTPELSQQIGESVEAGEFGGLAGLIQAAPLTEEAKIQKSETQKEADLKRRKLEAQVNRLEQEAQKQPETMT